MESTSRRSGSLLYFMPTPGTQKALSIVCFSRERISPLPFLPSVGKVRTDRTCLFQVSGLSLAFDGKVRAAYIYFMAYLLCMKQIKEKTSWQRMVQMAFLEGLPVININWLEPWFVVK